MQSSINNALKDLRLAMEPIANHPNSSILKPAKAVSITGKYGDALLQRLLILL